MSTATIQEPIPTQGGTNRDTTAKPETPIKKDVRQTKPLPAPNSDFYDLAATLPAEEKEVLKQVRAFMEAKVAPIITKYWVEDAFPFELLPAIKELNIGGVAMAGYGCRGCSPRLFCLICIWTTRVYTSLVHVFLVP